MNKPKPIILETKLFLTKKDAKSHFSSMLNEYNIGERLTEGDFLDLLSLLKRHKCAEQKIGCGVDHFKVLNNGLGSRGFFIFRTDGTSTDFSYLSCISEPSKASKVRAAFRNAVRLDLIEARRLFVAEHCDESGLHLCPRENRMVNVKDSHIDHVPPLTFEVLLHTFFAANGLVPEDVLLDETKDGIIGSHLSDGGLREDFRRFHAQAAVLDMIDGKTNLQQSSGHRIGEGRVHITLNRSLTNFRRQR